MEQPTGSTIHIEKVREHLRQYSLEVHSIVHKGSTEKAPEMAELASIYNMLHTLKSSMVKDLEVLELHLTRPENKNPGFAREKRARQRHYLSGAESMVEKLSCREREVLLMFAKGYSYNEVADIFSCKIATIQTYAKRIYKKLKVHSRSEAIFEAAHMGIISL